MALALLTSSLMGLVSLAITIFLGFAIDTRPEVNQHFLFALFTTFVAVLAQCMSIFYFIGTAKQVKDLMAEHPEKNNFITRTRQFKSRVFPPACYAILFTMAVFIIGAGVDTRAVPVWIHTILAMLALGTNLYALAREFQYMAQNNILLDEVAVLVGNPPQAE
jgi:hypothetical protein